MKLKDTKDLENARVKYIAVLSLKASEGEIQWSRYNAMLVVNTIFIGFISFVYSKDFDFPLFFRIIFWMTSLLGIFLCHSWHKMTERGFKWTQFWMRKANELEGNIDGEINPVKEGKKLRDFIGAGITEKYSLIIIKIIALIYFFYFIK